MAKLPDTPQQIAVFDLDPAPNCPTCASKVAQVRVDGVLTTGALRRTKGPYVEATVTMTGQTLTALPCGHLIHGDTETVPGVSLTG